MVCVFSPYIRKWNSYLQFHVNLTFYDFTAQHMSKLGCIPDSFQKVLSAKIITKGNFPILSMLFFFFFSLNSRNSIITAPMNMKLGVSTIFSPSQGLVYKCLCLTPLLPEYHLPAIHCIQAQYKMMSLLRNS